MPISKEILDELIKNYRNPEDLLGEQGLLIPSFGVLRVS